MDKTVVIDSNTLDQEQVLELCKNFFDDAAVGVSIKSLENKFKYLFWNKKLAEYTNIQAEEIINKNIFQVSKLVSSPSLHQAHDIELTKSGKSQIIDDSYTDKSGNTREFKIIKNLLTIGDKSHLILDIYLDVSREDEDKKNAKFILRKLQNLIKFEHSFQRSLDILNYSEDLEKVTRLLVENIFDYCSIDCCGFWHLDTDNIAKCQYFHNPSGLDLNIEALSEFDLLQFPYMAKSLFNGDNYILENTETINVFNVEESNFFANNSLKSVLVIPLIKDAMLQGFFVGGFVKSVNKFSEIDNFALRGLAKLYQIAYSHNERLVFKNREMKYLRLIMENMQIPMLILDLNSNIIFANHAAHKNSSLYDDLTNKKCYNAVCQTGFVPSWCPVKKVLTTLTSHTYKVERFGKKLLFLLQPILNEKNEIVSILETILDISSFATKAEALEMNNNLLRSYHNEDELIKKCLEILILDSDFNLSLQHIMEIFGKYLGFDSLGIYKYNEVDAVLKSIKYRANADTLQSIVEDKANISKTDNPIFMEHILNNSLFVYNCQHVDPKDKIEEIEHYLHQRRVNSCCTVAIYRDNKFWGCIGAEYVNESCIVNDSEKRLLSYASHIIEILLKREAEKKLLQRTELEKKMVLENLSIPIWLYDTNGQLILVNKAVSSLCGYNEKEIIKIGCGNIFCKRAESPELCPVKVAIKTLTVVSHKIPILGRIFLVTATPIFDDEHILRYVMKTAVDITDNI